MQNVKVIWDQKQNTPKSFSVNGVNQICPFSPVQFLPGKLAGQVVQVTKPCDTSCPHLEMQTKLIYLSCGGDIRQFIIENENPLP